MSTDKETDKKTDQERLAEAIKGVEEMYFKRMEQKAARELARLVAERKHIVRIK